MHRPLEHSDKSVGIDVGILSSERTHNCPFCGLSIDRDLNASINNSQTGIAVCS
ncbi:MAG: zinc ribbon domain-containing protein [Eubacteriales bacterium]|nr:zinc ribbon domain-containing protein [Eubacteriales bacterium]